MLRIASAPSTGNKVPADDLAKVNVIPVTSNEHHQEVLVTIFANNPSPFVNGPKSIKQLGEFSDRGIRFYLVTNGDGEYVGTRGFDENKKTLQNTVTDYRHRGKGYQLAAGRILIGLLAKEGHTEFRSAVMRSNTRIQRTMQAAGWEMTPDPDNPDLIRGVLRTDK